MFSPDHGCDSLEATFFIVVSFSRQSPNTVSLGEALMTDIETIWEEYHNKLRRFIVSRVADASTADDLLQEVFVKIHQRIGTLEDDARIQGWLYQVTRNAVIDYFRG